MTFFEFYLSRDTSIGQKKPRWTHHATNKNKKISGIIESLENMHSRLIRSNNSKNKVNIFSKSNLLRDTCIGKKISIVVSRDDKTYKFQTFLADLFLSVNFLLRTYFRRTQNLSFSWLLKTLRIAPG